MINQQSLLQQDPILAALIDKEAARQEAHIELIASENYVSKPILEAVGSILTNKYAEGYPGRRYYGGCEYVDEIEALAIERAKALFNMPYANVQPHSGSQANHAVFNAFLNPGDMIMGMSLAHGGHLTHGSPVNLSGKLYKVVSYGLNAQEEIDYDELERVALENKPKMLIGGASAYALRFDWARMREIADKIGAIFFVDMAHYSGLIAGGVYPSPAQYADVVASTTHKTLRGPRSGVILAKAEYAKVLDSSIFPRTQGGPLMHVIAAKAICFAEANTPEFATYQAQVIKNAQTMVTCLQARGYKIVSDRTESHLFLMNLVNKGLTGKEAEAILGAINITVNKNAVPNDPLGAAITSGIRIGTAAMTTRGFTEQEMQILAGIMADVLDAPNDQAIKQKSLQAVAALTAAFPAYVV